MKWRLGVNETIALFIVVMFIIVGIFSPWIAPHGPDEMDLFNRNSPPSKEHLFGTDKLGRDMMSLVIHGARVSLMVGFVSVFWALLLGVPLGLITGYFGGKIDLICMRMMDVLLSLPRIVLAIFAVTVLGPGLFPGPGWVGVEGFDLRCRLTGTVFLLIAGCFLSLTRAIPYLTGRYHAWRHLSSELLRKESFFLLLVAIRAPDPPSAYGSDLLPHPRITWLLPPRCGFPPPSNRIAHTQAGQSADPSRGSDAGWRSCPSAFWPPQADRASQASAERGGPCGRGKRP